MTFKEANESSQYEIVYEFEIKGFENICMDCQHDSECNAQMIFFANQLPVTSMIRQCKYFKRCRDDIQAS